MKRVIRVAALSIALVVSVAGCTSYQAQGLSGGFSETQLDTNVWEVSFRGNGYTSKERVRDFGLLRASELTLQNGYSYFLVMNEGDYTTLHSTGNSTTNSNVHCNGYGSSVNCYGNSSTKAPTQFNKHCVERVVVMYKDRPDFGVPYNAKMIYENVRAEYDMVD